MSGADRIFDVEVIVTRFVRVRVPDDPEILMGNSPEEVAEEFAGGGWPEYVLSQEEDYTIESVRSVPATEAVQ
jgi:hypothetical protein